MARREPVSGNTGLAKFLFTDASTLPKEKIAAWAGMLIAGEESWIKCGALPKRWRDTTYCELLAVTRSLSHFCERGRFNPGDHLTICMDNLVALQLLTGEVKPKLNDGPLRGAIGHVDHLIDRHGITATFSWVKGHQGEYATDWRSLINARVDRQARSRARQAAVAAQEAKVRADEAQECEVAK